MIVVHEFVDDKLYKTHALCMDEDKAFREVYAMERSSRYDWHREYRFAKEADRKKYHEWKMKNETISMFYGNATVD